MTNHLSGEISPYLLQHAENPVDWYPWGPDALEKARLEDKPIFLSIGYAACHWCHVMAHESFENPQTAAFMNDNFINIKVDREQRPDIDSIYMSAVVAMTGQGGWPLSVFITPEGKPFFGGTYFQPVRRYRMPAFIEVLQSVAQAWKMDRGEIDQSAAQITQHLQSGAQSEIDMHALQPETFRDAFHALIQSYDKEHGGWGRAPKFPQPMAIEFLLRRSLRGDPHAIDFATHTLRAMAKGGMYDVVGGGFARYSTDDHWRVPHFEKMLYDNAQLARVYLHAYLLTHQAAFRRVAEETFDFVLRELTHPQGGFFSSLDADSEGREGKFYIWTQSEIEAIFTDPQDLDLFLAAYAITPQGGFEGANLLQRSVDNTSLANKFKMSEQDLVEKLQHLHRRLLEVRQKRERPATDDKVLVSWNGLMLAGLAEAARFLHRADYLQAAVKNAGFILSSLINQDRLMRSWRNGKAVQPAYLEDYGAFIQGLLALYQSDPDPAWYSAAVTLAHQMVAHYTDPLVGFFDTGDEHEALLLRPKELQDNATPCGNSLAAGALLQLSAYTANGEWRDKAERMLESIQTQAARHPTAYAGWLQAMDFAVGPVYEVAILGSLTDPDTQGLVDALWSMYRPNLVSAISPIPPAHDAPPLLQDRPLQSGRVTAYVCQHFVCQQPVNDPVELERFLG
jgi:uncharacterized protein YyaL (SSP411 family)